MNEQTKKVKGAKFKVGDQVIVLTDLTKQHKVTAVWVEEWAYWGMSGETIKFALDDNTVHEEYALVADNPAIRSLAEEVEELKKKKFSPF